MADDRRRGFFERSNDWEVEAKRLGRSIASGPFWHVLRLSSGHNAVHLGVAPRAGSVDWKFLEFIAGIILFVVAQLIVIGLVASLLLAHEPELGWVRLWSGVALMLVIIAGLWRLHWSEARLFELRWESPPPGFRGQHTPSLRVNGVEVDPTQVCLQIVSRRDDARRRSMHLLVQCGKRAWRSEDVVVPIGYDPKDGLERLAKLFGVHAHPGPQKWAPMLRLSKRTRAWITSGVSALFVGGTLIDWTFVVSALVLSIAPVFAFFVSRSPRSRCCHRVTAAASESEVGSTQTRSEGGARG